MFQPQPFEVGSLYHVLYEYGDYLIRREDFPVVDPALGGNPGWCQVLLSKLVLLRQRHGWSEREAVRRARMDMQTKACLGLGLEQNGPSQPTLSRHERLMQELALDEVYEQRFTELLEALGLLSRTEPVLVDSVPIHGAGQQLDSYNLLAGAIRQGLAALASTRGESLEELAERLEMQEYIGRSAKGRFDVDWQKESSRVEFLARLVADARRVQDLLGQESDKPPSRNIDDENRDPPSGPLDSSDEVASEGEKQTLDDARRTIDEIIEHDVEVDEDGRVQGLRQRPAGDRRISLTDPDMRHGRKSAANLFAGYKAHILATLVYGFILAIKSIVGNRHDGEDLPDLVAELHERGYEPEWLGGDHAYGTIANHRHFRDNECGQLIARMPRPKNGGRFTKDMFDYDFENHVLTCPAGQVHATPRFVTRQGRRGRKFEFSPEQCGKCPLREQCVSPKAKPQRRSVFIIDDDERLIRDHLRERETPEFRARLGQRITVEHVIAGFAQCGGKKARRFGIENVAFDARLSALTYNLRRLGGLLRSNPDLAARLDEVVGAFWRFLYGTLWLRILKRCFMGAPVRA